MEAVAAGLQAAGLPGERIRYELFTADQPGRAARARIPDRARDHATTARVRIEGATRTVSVLPGTSLLEAARAAGIDAPFSCRAGVCSTCRCRLVSGEVEMIANHALEDYEVAQGYRLSCQSYPLSETVEIDYDL
jgi:ring-1,2-phenylacetyl-CoA epoxidase subunit PaaE